MITVKMPGLPDVRQMAQEASKEEVRRAMFAAKPAIEKRLRAAVAAAFKVRGSKFAKSFSGWVSYKNKDRMPVAVFKMKVWWSGIHASGGVIAPVSSKYLILPINTRGDRRIKPSLFRDFIHDQYHNISWHAAGGGKYLLTYERHKHDDARISKWRLTSDGKGSIDVPIAVAVPRVRLDSRIDLPDLTRTIVLPEIIAQFGT